MKTRAVRLRRSPFAVLAFLVTFVTGPVRPAAAAGAVYYIDTNGADSGSGSQQSPLRSIRHAATLARAGDLVVVNPGTYRESVVLTRSGQPGAPIVFRALPGAVLTSPDPSRALSAFDLGANAYITLQGFEISGGFGETVFVRAGAHDVELAGLHIHHNHTGIWIAGASRVVVRDCVLDHNYRTGLRIAAGAHDIQISDTRSESNDDGLGCDGESDGFNADDSTSDITFERATAAGNSDDGFDLQGTNMVLLQGVAQDNRCAGVKLWAGGYVENLLVEGSRIGVKVMAPAGATTVMENSTLSENAIGLTVGGAAHTLLVRNSIIAGPGKAVIYDAAVDLREDHNILYRPLSSERLIVRTGANGETLYSGDDVNDGTWQHASGQGDGTESCNPGFAFGSCRLASGSAAIDTGTPSGAPPVDLTGTPRPAGQAVDRGAFEWVPALPALQMRGVMARPDSAGGGSIRVRAEVGLGADDTFNPLTDAVTVSLRGARGDIVRANVPPGAWDRSQTASGTVMRMVPANEPAPAVSMRIHLYSDRVVLQINARGAALWVNDGTGITCLVELGRVRATGAATARMRASVRPSSAFTIAADVARTGEE